MALVAHYATIAVADNSNQPIDYPFGLFYAPQQVTFLVDLLRGKRQGVGEILLCLGNTVAVR